MPTSDHHTDSLCEPTVTGYGSHGHVFSIRPRLKSHHCTVEHEKLRSWAWGITEWAAKEKEKDDNGLHG